MPELPIDKISFWILIIPGFILVWSFRYFTDSKKAGDFEFLGLGIFWGIMNIVLLSFMMKWGWVKIPDADMNKWGVLQGLAGGLSATSFLVGFIGAQISKWPWVRWIIKKSKESLF